MTREIGWVLIATAGACALLLVLLLAWHELSGRSRARRYRSNVSANRLAIRQEQREADERLLAELDRRFGKKPGTRAGSISVELTLDTSEFDKQMRAVEQQLRTVDSAATAKFVRLAADLEALPKDNG